MIIKITNCTVFYSNGKIRNNQNVRVRCNLNHLCCYTKKKLLDIFRRCEHGHTMTTSFVATSTSKIII